MKHLEDFQVGQEWITAGRTVTESHVVNFAGLSGDFFPLHVDADYAARSSFGQRLVHGPLVYAIAVGCVSQSPVFDGSVLAFLGATDLRHTAPCLIGTTVRVRVEVVDVRASKNPHQGLCTLRYEVIDSQDATLMLADMLFLMATRAGTEAAQAIG